MQAQEISWGKATWKDFFVSLREETPLDEDGIPLSTPAHYLDFLDKREGGDLKHRIKITGDEAVIDCSVLHPDQEQTTPQLAIFPPDWSRNADGSHLTYTVLKPQSQVLKQMCMEKLIEAMLS